MLQFYMWHINGTYIFHVSSDKDDLQNGVNVAERSEMLNIILL